MCLQNKTSQQEFKNIKKMIYKYAIFLLKTMLSKKCLQNKTSRQKFMYFLKKLREISPFDRFISMFRLVYICKTLAVVINNATKVFKLIKQ